MYVSVCSCYDKLEVLIAVGITMVNLVLFLLAFISSIIIIIVIIK